MRIVASVALLVVVAAPSAAQSTYVGGSLMGELGRFGGVDVDEDNVATSSLEPLSRSWETLGFDVRVGRALGDRWGVELSFARGGNYEQRRSERLFPRLTPTPIVIPTLPVVTPTLPTLPILDFEFELRSTQQHTTVDSVAWLRQELSERLDLVFVGGISFNRIEAEQEIRISDTRLAIYIPFPSETETVSYGVGPIVGTDLVIDLSEHAALLAGVRMHGVTGDGLGGWLIRPSVGLRWSF